MVEARKQPRLSYYQRNKKHYQKGGKYYKYVPKADREPKFKIQINRGNYILSFD